MSLYDAEDGELSSLFHDPHEHDSPKEKTSSSYEYTMQRCSRSIRLTDGQKHHSLWGNHLWNSSVEAAKWVEQIEDISEKSILELGAGLGLPSIVAAFMGAANVVVTDYPDSELICRLESNCTQIFAGESMKPPIVKSLLWGNSVDIATVLACNANLRFDIIILSDLIFNHICHSQLCFTILELLAPTGKCVCTYGHHVPNRASKDLEFFDVAAKFRLVAKEVRQVEYEFASLEVKERENSNIVFVREIMFDSPRPPRATSSKTFDFPVVMIGTSLFHTLIAFFLSQAGIRALTLDECPFYGDRSTSLQLMDLYLLCVRKGFPFHFFGRGGEGLLQNGLQIDLFPKLLPAGSPWIDFLIAEGVDNYVEFEQLASVGMIDEDKLVKLPMTKSDIFSSDALSFVDKRKLCRFLTHWSERKLTSPDTMHTNKQGRGSETFIDVLRSFDLSPVLTRWITHVILHLEAHEADNVSMHQVVERITELDLLQSSGTPYSIPTYGQLDLTEGILRSAFLKGLTSMVGQGVYSITKKESPAQTPYWSIKTSEYDIRAPVIVKHASAKEFNDYASVLIATKSPIQLASGDNQTLDDNSLTILPEGETSFNPRHTVHIFSASKLEKNVWTYILRSRCKLQELVRFGEMWVEEKFRTGDLLFSCGWDTTIFEHEIVKNVDGDNMVCTDQSDGIYYSAHMLRRAKELAGMISDRLA